MLCVWVAIMKRGFVGLVLLQIYFTVYPALFDFSYDSAVYSAQKGQWEAARDKFTKLVVESPDRAEVLYDAGVTSFNTQEFEQAAAYFKNVTANPDASDKLKEQAHFNWGNTNVELNKLQEAIEQYEEVLKINTENNHAKHNLEVVKKMLEQQKQQQQKRQQQEQQQQEQEKQKDNKQDQDQKKDEEKEQQDQQKQDKQEHESEKQKQQEKKKDEQQGEDGANDDKQEKDGQKPEGDEPRTDDGKDQQRDERSTPKKDLDQEKEEKQKGNDHEHEETSEQKEQQGQHTRDDKQEEKKEQESKPIPTGLEERDDLDERTMQILRAIEEMDKEKSKDLMKANVSKTMAGQDGQNRW